MPIIIHREWRFCYFNVIGFTTNFYKQINMYIKRVLKVCINDWIAQYRTVRCVVWKGDKTSPCPIRNLRSGHASMPDLPAMRGRFFVRIPVQFLNHVMIYLFHENRGNDA